MTGRLKQQEPMTRPGVCSIQAYLEELRAALDGEDAAIIREALEDSEAHLRSEAAASPDRSESEILELIIASYGACEDVAAVYRAQRDLCQAYPPPGCGAEHEGT
jgi:uncharacterized membrane protein